MRMPTCAFGAAPVRPQRSTTVRPAAEVRLELDDDVPMSGLHELRSDQVRDGDGVVDRRTVPAVRLVVIPREVDIEVGDEAADSPGRA